MQRVVLLAGIAALGGLYYLLGRTAWAAAVVAGLAAASVIGGLVARVLVERRLFDGARLLAEARQFAGTLDFEDTEIEVRNHQAKALFVWFPLVVADVLVVLVIAGLAWTGRWSGVLPVAVVLGFLLYGTTRKLAPGPVIVLDSWGVTFPRQGASLPWRAIKEVRLQEVARYQRELGGEETVLCFVPRDPNAVIARLEPLTRYLASYAIRAYGTPLAYLAGTLDLSAEETAAAAERYAGRENLIRDTR